MLDRCPNCPGDFIPIHGDGPVPCQFLGLGERPGKKENENRIVFCGPTGQETDDTYLPLGGLWRGDIRLTNAVKCWALNNRTPSPAEVASCSRHFLPHELNQVRPEFIILLGAQAARVVDQPVRLEMHHGRPFWGSVLDGHWEGWIWPMYHPAAGLREGSKMTSLLEDFRHLGEWLDGTWAPPVPPRNVTKDYRYAETPNDLMDYLVLQAPTSTGRNWNWHVACDTENHGRDKFSIQVSHTPHTGRMILASNQRTMRSFVSWANDTAHIHADSGLGRTDWLFHFAHHDLDELERSYGIRIPNDQWRDTMQELYHQTNLPQGLKAAAFRMLGQTMRSWEDIVWPASIQALTEWMHGALVLGGLDDGLKERTEFTQKTYRCAVCDHRHKNGICKKCGCDVLDQLTNVKITHRIGPAAAIVKHVLRYATAPDQDLDTPYHPWKKLAEMKEEGLRGRTAEKWEWEAIEEVMGPMPILGIGNCDPEEALVYGCGDSDNTLQVGDGLVDIRRLQALSVADGGTGEMVVDQEDWDQ